MLLTALGEGHESFKNTKADAEVKAFNIQVHTFLCRR